MHNLSGHSLLVNIRCKVLLTPFQLTWRDSRLNVKIWCNFGFAASAQPFFSQISVYIYIYLYVCVYMCCCTLISSRCDRVEVNRATDSRAIRISYLLTLVLTDPGSLCAVCQRANAASTHAWMGRVNTCWYSKCTNTYAVSCLNIGRGEIWTSKMRSKIKISIFIPEDEASIVT